VSPPETMKTLSLNWFRMALALVVPTALGGAVAIVLWRRFDMMIGSVIGAGVILFTILLFFAAEFIEVTRFWVACQQASVPCRTTLSEFSRYGIYGIIGFVDAAGVFAGGMILEERRRRRSPVSG
jgi:cell shape-determining protein MreD